MPFSPSLTPPCRLLAGRKRSFIWTYFILTPVIIVFLYLLSSGPVLRMLHQGRISQRNKFVKTLYETYCFDIQRQNRVLEGCMRGWLQVARILACWFLVMGCEKRPDSKLPIFSLRLANRLTGEPVVGARIRPFCGIPGDTNDFRTDQQGLVEVRSWVAQGRTLVSIRAAGYSSTNVSVQLTNRPTTVLLDKTL